MASNRGPDRATWHPRRRRIVLILMLIGLLLLALAAWRVASRAALADRAVIATAVIDDVHQGPFLQSEDGRRSFTLYATVRYEVDGTPHRAELHSAAAATPARRTSAGRDDHRRLRPAAGQQRQPCQPGRRQASPAGPDGAGIGARRYLWPSEVAGS